jgi:hypothetical protein
VKSRRWVASASQVEHPPRATVEFATGLKRANGSTIEIAEALAEIVAALDEYAALHGSTDDDAEA